MAGDRERRVLAGALNRHARFMRLSGGVSGVGWLKLWPKRERAASVQKTCATFSYLLGNSFPSPCFEPEQPEPHANEP